MQKLAEAAVTSNENYQRRIISQVILKAMNYVTPEWHLESHTQTKFGLCQHGQDSNRHILTESTSAHGKYEKEKTS